MSKIFIIGLPRTGTTSVCAALLQVGFTVAHTAYTRACVEQAKVLADTPIYVDYPKLDRLFPNSKFIYLDRPRSSWLPSIVQLLDNVKHRLVPGTRGYHPILARCFEEVFGVRQDTAVAHSCELWQRYQRHRARVLNYFDGREGDLLVIDLRDEKSYSDLMSFLSRPTEGQFPCLNQKGRINAWQGVKHPNKVDSFAFGQHRRKYYDF